ncbi:Phosphoribosyltransferase [uncultured Pleomorphomonas sp.]|uniref:Phosphoribosyltransferase n=1 Tax=uncultured Pleomorphomonas sp. TaxID=442121 RepID=A0A212LDN7_9HYPH|nr:phosphoribosyltransferase [uncultured Pleomorphomonas sp.]SCM75469.1 Phosphoribosyltransferase [uncultured Pleomorphomonas sp.]
MQPHDFWQTIHPAGAHADAGPFVEAYPARFTDGRQLLLPIRALADGRHGLASLIVNQASFAVLSALADDLAARLRPFSPDVVVGLPTLGLTLAAAVAERLGHGRYVPCGTSRKFWYVEELSVPMSSVTTHHARRLYVDPRMLPLLEGRRVALVDDVISSGASIVAGLRLMAAVAVEPVAIGAAMLQTERWRPALAELSPVWPDRVVGSLVTPLLERTDAGWIAEDQGIGPKSGTRFSEDPTR